MIRRIPQVSNSRVAVIILAGCALASAQQPGGWRRVNDAPNQQQVEPGPDQIAQSDAYGQPLGQRPQAGPPPADPGMRPEGAIPPPPLPPELRLASGTYITVRLNQGLSSDRNQAGDPFSATLTQPMVIDGVVVAQRGQMVYGRVAQAQRQKASQPS